MYYFYTDEQHELNCRDDQVVSIPCLNTSNDYSLLDTTSPVTMTSGFGQDSASSTYTQQLPIPSVPSGGIDTAMPSPNSFATSLSSLPLGTTLQQRRQHFRNRQRHHPTFEEFLNTPNYPRFYYSLALYPPSRRIQNVSDDLLEGNFLEELELCPPFYIGHPDPERTIVDFIHDFWSKIHIYEVDPLSSFLKLTRLLMNSDLAKFVGPTMEKYLIWCMKNDCDPRFEWAEDMLLKKFWTLGFQQLCLDVFQRTIFSESDQVKRLTAFVSKWSRRLQHMDSSLAPPNPAWATFSKLPEHFRSWAQANNCYEQVLASFPQLLAWIRSYLMFADDKQSLA